MEVTGPAVDGPENARPVILLHGSGGSGQRSWQPQLPLAERWRLIRPTRRGWVPGGELPAGWTEMAVDVVELLDRVGPAHLVGFSTVAWSR